MTKRSENPNSECTDEEEPQNKRVRLNLGQKIEAAQKLNSGMTTTAVAKEYGCSVRAMKNIKRHSTHLLQLNEGEATSLHLKSVRAPKFPAIDSKLIEFVHFARVAKIPLSLSVLKKKATSLRDELLKQTTITGKARGALQSFSVSDGWICNFVKRYGFRSVALRGQNGNADAAAVTKGLSELRRTLHGYSVECIYNVDETSLFYKLLPRRSYVTTHENDKSVRNMANMKSKDRITAYLCANADGTKKVPMAIIGAAKNPPCFGNSNQPVSYFHQKSAWSDTATFRRWFQDVFLKFVREHTSKPVALVMGNCGPHSSDLVDSQGQVTILTLPPTCAAMHLPMGAGITEAWKLGYRHELLTRLVANVEDREERRTLAECFMPGMRGICEGHDPSLFDASEIIFSSWGAISRDQIAQSWIKINILPVAIQAQLTAQHGQAKKVRGMGRSPMLKNVAMLFSKLLSNLPSNDPMFAEIEEVSREEIEEWINVEEDIDVFESVVNDLTQEIGFRSVDDVDSSGNTAAKAECANHNEDTTPIPRPGQIAKMFKHLEELAMNTGVTKAFPHLRNAKRVFMESCDQACAQNNTPKAKQTPKPHTETQPPPVHWNLEKGYPFG